MTAASVSSAASCRRRRPRPRRARGRAGDAGRMRTRRRHGCERRGTTRTCARRRPAVYSRPVADDAYVKRSQSGRRTTPSSRRSRRGPGARALRPGQGHDEQRDRIRYRRTSRGQEDRQRVQAPAQLGRWRHVPSSIPARRASSSTRASATRRLEPRNLGAALGRCSGHLRAHEPEGRCSGPALVSTVCTRACGTTCQRRQSIPCAT